MAGEAAFKVRFEVDGDGRVSAVFDSISQGSKKSKEDADGLTKSLGDVALSLERQAALAGKSSREAAVAFEVQRGALRGLDDASKQHIVTLARQADAASKAATDQETAAKKAADAIESAKKEAYEFGTELGEALKIGAVALTAFAATGLALVIKNSIDAQNEVAQLQAVLRSTGQEANFTSEQLVGMAEDIAKASNFSAGEITNAETRLLSYSGIISTNFPAALQVAIDQAQRLGISVEQSAETIGRALESPTKAAAALAQQGFGAAFTKEVRNGIQALVDAGKEAEAQAVILDILNDSYAGAASGARDTLGGAFIALKNTANDLLEGDAGGSGLRGVRDAVEELTESLNDPAVKSGFAAMVEGSLSLSTVLADLVGWADRSWESLGRFATLQFGGTQQVRDLQQIRFEMKALQEESAARGNGSADTFLGRLGRGWAGAGNLLGGNSAAGMSDADLNARLAELRRLESQSLELFGDPTRPRVNFSDDGDISASMLRPGRDARTNIPNAEDPADRKKRLAEEAREARQLQNAYDRLYDSLNQQATLGQDNTNVARVRYETEQGGLQKVSAAQKQLLLDKAAYVDQMEEERRLMQEMDQRETDYREVIDAITEARIATGLSNEQLEIRRNLLAAGVTAESAWGQQIIASTEALQEQRDAVENQIDQMDALRDSARGIFSSQIREVNSLGDAINRMLDNYLNRMLDISGSGLIDQLFGQRGTTGGGASSGWMGALTGIVGSFFGAPTGASAASTAAASSGNYGAFNPQYGWNFGGGRATGGDARRGSIYEVTEYGVPELYRQGGRSWLLPGADGVVVPASAASAPGGSTVAAPVTVNVIGAPSQPQVSQRTNAQGGPEIDVMFKQIENRLAGNMASGTGSLYAATKSRLGPQGGR